jgi:hypothetical protein
VLALPLELPIGSRREAAPGVAPGGAAARGAASRAERGRLGVRGERGTLPAPRRGSPLSICARASTPRPQVEAAKGQRGGGGMVSALMNMGFEEVGRLRRVKD